MFSWRAASKVSSFYLHLGFGLSSNIHPSPVVVCISIFRRNITEQELQPVVRRLDFSILDTNLDIARRPLSVFQPHRRHNSPRRFNPKPQPRPTNPLIDDSAIESDGEGGDISSCPTSPDTLPPPSPPQPSPPQRRPLIQPRINLSIPRRPIQPPPVKPPQFRFRSIPRPPTPIPINKVIKKTGPQHKCDLCALPLYPGQLPKHRGGKRCKKQQALHKQISPCAICNKIFDTRSNKITHSKSKHK